MWLTLSPVPSELFQYHKPACQSCQTDEAKILLINSYLVGADPVGWLGRSQKFNQGFSWLLHNEIGIVVFKHNYVNNPIKGVTESDIIILFL